MGHKVSDEFCSGKMGGPGFGPDLYSGLRLESFYYFSGQRVRLGMNYHGNGPVTGWVRLWPYP